MFRNLILFSITFLALAFSASAHQTNSVEEILPLGDGHVSSAPKVGYVFSCKTSFSGGGAKHAGDWIVGDKWKPNSKPIVQGKIMWPDHSFTISDENNQRVVRSNDLPDHATGIFPIGFTDSAYAFDTNPNSISKQSIILTLSKNPQLAAQPSCLPMGMIGIALTGVAIFNGLDDQNRDAAAHEVQDLCNGHPEQRGTYHYHNLSPCMKDDAGKKGKHSDLAGYAVDGFGIYGEFGEEGKKLSNSDLDACHGHSHQLIWDGVPQKIYHYHLTKEYPYTLSCFRGTVNSKQMQKPQLGSDGPFSETDQQRDSHRRILEAAASDLGIDARELRRAMGPPPPDFSRAAQILNIDEEKLRAAFEKARK
jgi:hypothetical protein